MFGESHANQVKERRELREDEHLLALIHAVGHQIVDGFKLGRAVFRVRIHQPRIAAKLAQQREFRKNANPARVEIGIPCFGECGAQPLFVRRIQFALLPRQLHGHDVLELVGQIGKHVLFQPSFDEQADQRPQLVSHDGLFRTGRQNRLLVPFAESRISAQQPRHKKIEDAPQFAQTVLDWRAGQCEAMRGVHLLDHFRHLGGVVLDVLRLVEHHACEPAAGVFCDIATQQIVGCNEYVRTVLAFGGCLGNGG